MTDTPYLAHKLHSQVLMTIPESDVLHDDREHLMCHLKHISGGEYRHSSGMRDTEYADLVLGKAEEYLMRYWSSVHLSENGASRRSVKA